MPILMTNGEAKFVRLSLPLAELPALMGTFNRINPATAEIEALGASLINQRFPPQETKDFIRRVCLWGGRAGTSALVLQHNNHQQIATACQEAVVKINSGDTAGAISSIITLKGLAVSFGSKHLKFLSPERAVVLDSIISQRLGYELSPAGYAEFVNDCAALRDMVNEAKVPPPNGRDHWRISDIEMAVFQKLSV